MSGDVIEVLPDDAHNRALVANVHPKGWENPKPRGRYNLVVIGGGTAGLVSAMGAAGLGARVALVERHLLGGDCLNYGCVPSKALIRAARAAYDAREVASFGASGPGPITLDFAAVMERMRRLRAEIAHHDAASRFAKSGIDVFLGDAAFVSPEEVEVAGERLRFSRAVIATGARAARPSIPGLAEAGFLTNESVFSLTSLPQRLAVIGAGPIGCELAQAFRRFGSEVTILSVDARLLPREDPDAALVLQAQLSREGISLVLGAKISGVSRVAGGRTISFDRDRGQGPEELTADEILVAVGRAERGPSLGPPVQQTIGRTFWHVRGMRALRGTALATILGPAPDGSLRANHHFAFEDGTLRTQDDVVRIRPTNDPGLFDAETEVFVVDGTGQFAGLRGQARGEGQVSFCGDEGRIELRGQLCPAAGSSR